MKLELEKLLKGMIKVAAVALTAPATWAVAGQLYDDPFQRFIVQVAALVLVEGALLLGWHQLDNDRKAETGQRILYAAITIVAYGVLWFVAIAHNEGIAGIAFRLTLAVLIGYSIFESGILANIKIKRSVNRDISKHRKARKLRQKVDLNIYQVEQELRLKDSTLIRQLESERLSKATTLEHQTLLREIKSENSTKSTPKRGNLTYPIEKINGRRKFKREKRLQLFGEFIHSNPELSPTELVEWGQETFGVAESTAWKDYAELKPEPVHSGNGSGNGHQ